MVKAYHPAIKMEREQMFKILTRPRIDLVVEILLAMTVLAGLIYIIAFTMKQGYLPQPYFYGSQSLFTDWTVSAYFANNVGAYTAFYSVYPPLSFVFLRLFSIHSCYNYDDIFTSRDCDWVMPVTLLAFFTINFFIAYNAYLAIDRRTALIRAFVIGFGLPSVYAMERGNLIIPCFTFFMLGNSRVLKSARMKWVCSAISINFKPYLILSLVGPLLRRRWRWFEGAAIAGLGVYLVTFFLNGNGDPIQIVTNIMLFATTDSRGIFERAVYASSYKPIIDLLQSNFPIMMFMGSKPMDLMTLYLPILMNTGKIGTIICFVMAVARPGVIPVSRLSALAIGWVLISQDPGGYAVLFFFFLVLMEPWRGPFLIVALLATYIMSIPADVMILKVAHQPLFSYITRREVGYDLGVNIGELLRPGLILIVEFGLMGASIVDALRGERASIYLNRRIDPSLAYMLRQ